MIFPKVGEPFRCGWTPPVLAAEDKAECRLLATELDATLVQASRREIIAHLTRLAAHFWSDRSETQWRYIFADYALDLQEIPLDILVAGIAAYRRKAKWWPKASELIELMEGPLAERRRQRDRLRMLADKHQGPDPTQRSGEVKRLGELIAAREDG